MLSSSEKISISPGRSWAFFSWVFTAFAVLTVVFSLSASFSRREQAVGFLVANPQIVRVSTPRGGRVQAISAVEGSLVRRGDVLMLIDPDPVFINGRAAAETEIERLTASEREIYVRIDAIGRQTAAKDAELAKRISALRKQVEALRAGQLLQQQNVGVLAEDVRIGQDLLARGALSATDVKRRDGTLREAEISTQNLAVTTHEAENNLAELEGEQVQLPIDSALKLSDLQQTLLELAQRKTEAGGRLLFQVTAPVDGRIDTILSAVGQTVDANVPLVSLLPENSILEAELYVPSRAIVFVEPSQRVRIAYAAFPYARYGFADGVVASISQTVLRPDEVRKPVPINEPTYRVTVALERQVMRSLDKEIPLRPGLNLTADIILDRQTVARWILRSASELWARM